LGRWSGLSQNCRRFNCRPFIGERRLDPERVRLEVGQDSVVHQLRSLVGVSLAQVSRGWQSMAVCREILSTPSACLPTVRFLLRFVHRKRSEPLFVRIFPTAIYRAVRSTPGHARCIEGLANIALARPDFAQAQTGVSAVVKLTHVPFEI
jgi:hypothetical protein